MLTIKEIGGAVAIFGEDRLLALGINELVAWQNALEFFPEECTRCIIESIRKKSTEEKKEKNYSRS